MPITFAVDPSKKPQENTRFPSATIEEYLNSVCNANFLSDSSHSPSYPTLALSSYPHSALSSYPHSALSSYPSLLTPLFLAPTLALLSSYSPLPVRFHFHCSPHRSSSKFQRRESSSKPPNQVMITSFLSSGMDFLAPASRPTTNTWT
jgi:hypothetical protein